MPRLFIPNMFTCVQSRQLGTKQLELFRRNATWSLNNICFLYVVVDVGVCLQALSICISVLNVTPTYCNSVIIVLWCVTSVFFLDCLYYSHYPHLPLISHAVLLLSRIISMTRQANL